MTPQVLTSDKTQFSIGPTNFYAIDTPNAKLIYSTSLEESRQIYAISRTLDYTQVGVANENLHLSLTHLTQQNYLEHLDNYRFYIDTEIHLSPNRMPFRHYRRHCLKGGASMVDTPTAFYRVINSFKPDSIWINAHVNVTGSDYSIFLDTIEVYPKNNLGIGNPRVYYFENMQRKLISTINTTYSYYNSQSEAYWNTHFYHLQTAMTRDGKAEIYVPEDERFLTPQEFHHYCACHRTPSISTKIFNDLKREITHFEHQKHTINLGIEPERLQNSTMGSLLPILKPYLNENPIKRDSSFYIENVTPLIPSNITHDNLLHSFMFLSAKKIGTSVALALLESSLNQIKQKYGATFLHNLWNHDDKETDFFDLSSLSLTREKFTLIVQMDNNELYNMNVSSNIFVADALLKNITITNERFSNFLKTTAQRLLLEMAADSIMDKIDYSQPVLAVVKRGKSFLTCTFFITTVSPENTVTNYLASALPSSIQDSVLYGIKVPHAFSSISMGHSYRFHDAQSQALDSCVNSFMGTSNFDDIAQECPLSEHPTQKLRILQTLGQNNLLLARGFKETIKIVCPSNEPHFYTMTHDVLVLYVHQTCETNLISKTGVLTIRRNDSGISPQHFQPHLLFAYNLDIDLPTDIFQWIIIASISSILGLFILILLVALYLLYKRRITAEIVSQSPSEQKLDSESMLIKETNV